MLLAESERDGDRELEVEVREQHGEVSVELLVDESQSCLDHARHRTLCDGVRGNGIDVDSNRNNE
jgi:hypothetical protein